ncbi:small-conductance mechanosensitive channel [Belliella baltica DSM 15883]|uniref:Small-conductance mechanosensitive channel n=1 Tax=Belliella baltica (strain DSM 15883 / CIP 108006 / LMG 21964 / BA134) TaxID=866536 RepID=I3Z3P2_BELBD|nr:mechanosensitive ion channel domain-containing protein [Belliella baltica]AFL83860.1 small-conductance mechanosensitive channel [Belliella baltica DSM 15883]
MELDLETIQTIKEKAVEFLFDFGPNILGALIVFFIGKYIISLLLKAVDKIFVKYEIDASLATFLKSFSKAILYVLLFITIATQIGIELTSFIAILGAAGLAVGLALQGSLANFAGGVLILIFKPFKVGDTLEAQGTLGSVESIDILYTKIRNFDNKLVTIPNGALANNLTTNHSEKPTRRVDISVGVAYGTDLKKTRQVILSTLKRDERIHADPEPVVKFTNFGDSSLDLTVRCWTDTGDLWPVYWDNMEALKEAFEANDIEIPFPQRDVNHFYPEGKKE